MTRQPVDAVEGEVEPMGGGGQQPEPSQAPARLRLPLLAQRALTLVRLARGPVEWWSAAAFLARAMAARRPWRGRSSRRITGAAWLRLRGVWFRVGLAGGDLTCLHELLLERVYERDVDFVPRAGWRVVDVGANIGVFSLLAAARGACVWAFEPNRHCLRQLERSARRNGLAHLVQARPWALGASAGVGRLVAEHGLAHRARLVASAGAAASVPVVALDAALAPLRDAPIDLLKIDVEGSETAVLAGAGATLPRVERVVLEYHGPDQREGVRRTLAAAGLVEVLHQPLDAEGRLGLLYFRRSGGPCATPTPDRPA